MKCVQELTSHRKEGGALLLTETENEFQHDASVFKGKREWGKMQAVKHFMFDICFVIQMLNDQWCKLLNFVISNWCNS